jgi:HAD superfamily hydrolase (TIGR01509 family)
MSFAIFFDMWGVLIDGTDLPRRWQEHVGEFLAPRLGGDIAAWGPANEYAAARMFARYRDPMGTPRETHPRLRRLWLREMCERVGVAPPKNAGALAEETIAWVTSQISVPTAGAIETVRALKSRGHRLFTSAGAHSVDTDGYLRAMGIRELFDEVYGSDVIDRWKTNAGFYRKTLERSGVPGEDALTVDDQEKCLDWAKRAGFSRTFLLAPAASASAHERVATLSELVARLEG